MYRLRVGRSENQSSYSVNDGNFSLVRRLWGSTSYSMVSATFSSQDKHKINLYHATENRILKDYIFIDATVKLS